MSVGNNVVLTCTVTRPSGVISVGYINWLRPNGIGTNMYNPLTNGREVTATLRISGIRTSDVGVHTCTLYLGGSISGSVIIPPLQSNGGPH